MRIDKKKLIGGVEAQIQTKSIIEKKNQNNVYMYSQSRVKTNLDKEMNAIK